MGRPHTTQMPITKGGGKSFTKEDSHFVIIQMCTIFFERANQLIVQVYVSSESSWNALSPLAVMLENRKGRMHLCGILKESKGSNLQDVHCAGTFSGRYVVIKSMTKTALNLVEVEVSAD